MTKAPRASYSSCRDRVSILMDEGESFVDVEEAIEHTDLEQDEKAALWLFAFSSRDRPAHAGELQRRLVGVAD